MSEAIREYFGRRYDLSLTGSQGLELTTEELLVLLGELLQELLVLLALQGLLLLQLALETLGYPLHGA